MADKKDNTVLVEGARIIFRNFEGKEGQYNKAGDRNFGLILPEDVATQMAEDGWNIKYLKPSEEDEEEQKAGHGPPWIPVAVGFGKGKPPKIMTVTERGRTQLDESTVEILDWADISNVDLIIRPYTWDVNGRGGIKAYLQTMFVTINEDPLEQKYGDMDQQ